MAAEAELDPSLQNAVAIVGMSGRFPGARDLDAFWQNLRDGVETVRHFTDEELVAAGQEPIAGRDDRIAAGGILDDIDLFDARFFGIGAREAAAMDPQHRLFLECAWQALESAGHDPRAVEGTTAVFGGCSVSTYFLNNVATNPEVQASMGASQVNAALAPDFLTLRVSYLLDLRGPSVTLHTTCSTSLVAIAQAWAALLNYQCDTALAGGATVRSPQVTSYAVDRETILSPDGHCRAFDAAAHGTVSGEGVGVVVLKRLEDALRDGDPVRAVLRSAAVNNEGFGRVSIYAPSVKGQAEVVAVALAVADVDPATVGYIEAHGTGTSLGDPIEIAALTDAFRERTDRKQFCAIGSVKTNIGHADAGAGAAGIIKTVLALEHGQIPPSLHFERPNPEIDFAGSPFFVADRLTDWKAVPGVPRRAGVSSFGMGGTNAHVLLEEAPDVARAPAQRPPAGPQLLLVSARTPAALDMATANLAAHLESRPGVALEDVAFTLQCGRTPFEHRRAVVAADVASARAALEARSGAVGNRLGKGKPVFLFSGQGAQYAGMARGLYAAWPGFRTEIDHCAEILRPLLGRDLREVLLAEGDVVAAADADLVQTALAQPALFAIEVACARGLIGMGVQPEAMIGHSVGELAAATVAGVFSLEDGLKLVAERGRLMQAQPPGAMLGVGLGETEVRARLGEGLSVAAVNAPQSCVVSGPEDAVAALVTDLEREDVPCRRLHTSHAFHSAMMDPVVTALTAQVAAAAPKAATLAMVSTVTGGLVAADAWSDPAYWGRNLREPVRFADAIAAVAEPGQSFVEVGPGNTLARLARQCLPADRRATTTVTTTIRHPQEQRDDVEAFEQALGQLWCAGVRVDWAAGWEGRQPRRAILPTYPFERERYWLEPGAAATGGAALRRRSDVGDWSYAPVWRQSFAVASGSAPAGRWLLFEDDRGLADAITAHLTDAEVVRVRAGAAFAEIDAGSFEIRPEIAEDHDALLRALGARGALPDRVVHLWNVIGADGSAPGPERLARARVRGFDALLLLAQAWMRCAGEQPLRLETVTDDLFAIRGDEARVAERATMIGPCRVLPQELPGATCRHVDIDLPAGDEAAVAARLLAEWRAPVRDVLVGYRGDQRWVQTFEPVPLAAAPAPAPGTGAWLITGGLGGIGLVLAEALAASPGAKLVLVGRTGLAADPTDERGQRRAAVVRALEQAGAEVLVVAADVADPDAVRAAVAAGVERFGAIRGVVHAAGLATGGMMAARSRDDASAVIDPKVNGTFALCAALGDQPLEHFVVCSALAAFQGGVGAADYCGANAFLDAFVHTAEARCGSTRVVAIDWDLWSETGMGVEAPVSAALRAAREEALAQGIRNEEGADAFLRVLASPLRHVAVSTLELPARFETSTQAPPEEAAPAVAASRPEPATHARPELGTAFVAPSSPLQEDIAGIVTELLGLDAVGVEDNLFELGFDSLLGHQLIARVKRSQGIAVPLRTVLETPTVVELAKYVEAVRFVSGG